MGRVMSREEDWGGGSCPGRRTRGEGHVQGGGPGGGSRPGRTTGGRVTSREDYQGGGSRPGRTTRGEGHVQGRGSVKACEADSDLSLGGRKRISTHV